MGNEARLVIDPVKRKISTKDEKIRLVQYDNNSVRIYFEIPRYVINHEMLDSSTVEVHFDNISSDRKQKNSDIYKVTDITVDPEDENKVIFSWLVGKTATQLVGSVEIALHFGRTDDPEYAWHTTNYSGINVFEGKHNETPVVDMYPDAFYELKRELEQKIEDAVEEIEPVELAQDLEGNATDKAVSQAAVNAYKAFNDAGVDFLIGKVAEHETALGDKVDKITDEFRVYTTDADGELYARPMSTTGYVGYIVQYDADNNKGNSNSGGFLNTNVPTKPYHAANKKYVDEGFVAKTNSSWKVYGTGEGGSAKFYSVSNAAAKRHLAEYNDIGGGENLGFYADGYLVTCDPVNPYHASNKKYVDDLMRTVYGTVYDFKTVDSTQNPVTVPANVLKYATIDKIGTGFVKGSLDLVSTFSVVTSPVEAVIQGYNVVKLSSDDFVSAPVTVAVDLKRELAENEPYSFRVSVVSGSINSESGQTIYANDGLLQGELGTLQEGNNGWVRQRIEITVNQTELPVRYNDVILKFEVASRDAFTGYSPVAGVKVENKTVFTVPKAIKDLTLNGAKVYGVAKSENEYNYLDLTDKNYVVMLRELGDGSISALETATNIDVSAYLTDEDGEIDVATGDTITFTGEDGNPASDTVPHTITYMVKEGD